MNLLHVCLQNLHVFQSFSTNLALDFLSVSRHQHLVGVPQVSLVRLFARDDHLTMWTLDPEFLPP